MSEPDENDDDDDGPVTEADLKETQERWADPKYVPSVPELFSRPVYGPGLRGDVAIGDESDPPFEQLDPPGFGDGVFKEAALESAAPVILALEECEEEVRAEAIVLFKQLASGDLDREERRATVALLAEMLFPDADNKGFPGLDLEEIAKETSPEARETLAQMDGEEATFAAALRRIMDQKGMTQEKLAETVGIGQPAISMMLQRNCRPQKRTIARLAEALGVYAEELWPLAKGKQ